MNEQSPLDYETEVAEIARTLAAADNPDQIKDFLYCLLTPYEIGEVASRWALVKRIDQGSSQRNIASELGLSLCKITRGSKQLKKENSAFKKFIDLSRAIEK